MSSHWPFFRKFVKAELAVGGPDCQFTLMIQHAKRNPLTRAEWVWLIGCYAAHHCVMPAYEIFTEFPLEFVLTHPKRLKRWLVEHWDSLPVRPEMRSHRMVEKRWQCLMDFARYADSGDWQQRSYDELWDESQHRVKYYGRYMALKVLELLHRTVRPDMPSIDIRAKGAWSPRRTMALLFPEEAPWLADRSRNEPRIIVRTERFAKMIQERLQDHGIVVSMYQLQVLLCNYRECLQGRFYPGCGHDEELRYLRAFGQDFDVRPWYRTRKAIFPHKHLGELNDWDDIRDDVNQQWIDKAKSYNLPIPKRGS